MKFIVDAQLPYRLKTWLTAEGYDTTHTRDLPDSNETEDFDIAAIAENENRTVISKDSDFLKLYILKGKPPIIAANHDRQHRQPGFVDSFSEKL